MTTAAIRDVELVAEGTWAASTGVTKITREDLEAILAAAADPDVDAAPVKLGHASPLNELGDGAPAYGWVRPTRVVDRDGRAVLLGDLVGMPAKLAAAAPTAYRRRSVEIAWGLRTPAGAVYRAVLTGVALLGVQAPAVKGLADVLALYSSPAPPAADRATALELVEGLDAGAVSALRAMAPHVTPEQLERAASALGARDTADVPPPSTDAPHDLPQTKYAQSPTPEAVPMPLTDTRVRELMGLEADADAEAALTELLGRARAGDGDGTGGTATPGTTTDPAGTTPATAPAAPAPGGDAPGGEGPTPGGTDDPTAAVGATPELVTLSAGTVAELRRQAAEGAEALARIRAQEREQLLTTALREGRITPAERSVFAAQLEEDDKTGRTGTRTLLSSLAPRFPVTELGHASDVPAPAADDSAWDEFTRTTFGLGTGS